MLLKTQTLVVGAGISGLSVAYALQKQGVDVLLVESCSKPGGVIRTIRRDGYLIECGPQSFSGNARITAISNDLGLSEARLTADPRSPRYVLIDNQLRAVPSSIPALVTSPFFAGGTRFGIIRDLIGTSTAPQQDESIASFVRRKFSDTLLDRLVGPFVSGIYAGDPEKLSLRAAFPLLHEAESISGSVLRGFFKAAKRRRNSGAPGGGGGRGSLQTFRDGNETFTTALAAALGDRLRLNAQLSNLQYLPSSQAPNAARFGANLRTSRGSDTIEAERLVIAVPTDAAARLLAPLDPRFESAFTAIEYAGVAVLSLAYRCTDIGHDAQGFGFLVPRSAKQDLLGVVWNSSLFAGRAPEGQELLTCFLGGATNPGILQLPESEIIALAHRELMPLMDLRNPPVFSHLTAWPRAIPQYNLGHFDRMTAIEAARSSYPGLWFAGNYLDGPAIGACVDRAAKIAEEIRISFAN
jgi:protoporphyrinogen/coproporphyrinogen III oxidase